jgi:hypothetical protein
MLTISQTGGYSRGGRVQAQRVWLVKGSRAAGTRLGINEAAGLRLQQRPLHCENECLDKPSRRFRLGPGGGIWEQATGGAPVICEINYEIREA